MRKGEKGIWGVIIGVVALAMANNAWQLHTQSSPDPGIPFYSTATPQVNREGSDIYRNLSCKSCHTLWTITDLLETVPSPPLDGIGSVHNEAWFYRYFSAPDPQSILPSRMKKQYRMPSYAYLSEHDRIVLAKYMAGLKVKNWYLESTRKTEYEKLTGKEYKTGSISALSTN